MPAEDGVAMPGPDDFDRQLRDLTTGAGGTASFHEPSAAERARLAARRQGLPRNWRQAGRARKLSKPVTPSDGRRPRSTRFRRRGPRRGAGMPRAFPSASPGSRRRRLLSLAKAVGILVGFVVLLVLMHMLGLGPR